MQSKLTEGNESRSGSNGEQAVDRREAFSKFGTTAMMGGLAAGYGAFAYIAARFLYPSRGTPKRWMFVCELARLAKGDGLKYQTPAGATVNIARTGDSGSAEDFIALSSVCPHLGCQVKWEGNNNRFFCPCHNGVFDANGKATEGPPAVAGQSLDQYKLMVADGLLYIEVTVGDLAKAGPIEESDHPQGPGHDPCLAPRPNPREA